MSTAQQNAAINRSGNGRQSEQFRLGEGEAQVVHLDGDHSPHQPDGKAHQQARNGNPEIPVGDAFAFPFPEVRVLNVPVFDICVQLAHSQVQS